MSRKRYSRQPLKRPYRARKVKTTVLIVCEGKKTEPKYFNFLKKEWVAPGVNVEICGRECGSAPINVVDFAIGQKQGAQKSESRDKYDQVWCVFDVDKHESLARALDKASANGLRVALSNPCFEYWYILHFEKTGRAFQSSAEAVKRLKKHYSEYDKGNSSICEKIFKDTDLAIKHSEEVIIEKQWGDNLSHCNPSTHVHRLVKLLQDIAKE